MLFGLVVFVATECKKKIVMISDAWCFQVSVQPFILRSQLYSSVKDRTQVDRELEVCFVRNYYSQFPCYYLLTVMMFAPLFLLS